MSKRSSTPRALILSGILIAVLLAWIGSERARHREPVPPLPDVEEPLLVWQPEPRPRKPKRSEPPPPLEECVPHASSRCERGDVWSFDSCGVAEQKLEECGTRACENGACSSPAAGGCLGPPEGLCVGDRVELCVEGRPFSVDCAAQGMRCTNGAEGAACAPVIPEAERCDEAARCEDDWLARCVDGRRQRTDCRRAGGRCAVLPELGAGCVTAITPVVSSCGPCGCLPAGGQEQRCDGLDEDFDGHIDEELDCGPVALLAFRITHPKRDSAISDDSIRLEVAVLNRIFAATELPGALQFTLDDIVDIPSEELFTLEEDAFKKLANDGRVHPGRGKFYVPIVFADEVHAPGGVPKPGMSTLPNGTCGGIQEGHGPDVGLIAVARARYPTTLAHEIGHFLGLCHTHDEQRAAAFAAYSDAQAALKTCQPACRLDGDGICDTPLDPGPDVCRYDFSCQAACSTGAQPDASNLMSYYADCRETFSAQQMELMQHTLALRRGWQRCLGENCPCRIDKGDCPMGMSCRPRPEGHVCALEGPQFVGMECHGADDCRGSALCVRTEGAAHARCARYCEDNSADCTCSNTSDGLGICLQDIGL